MTLLRRIISWLRPEHRTMPRHDMARMDAMLTAALRSTSTQWSAPMSDTFTPAQWLESRAYEAFKLYEREDITFSEMQRAEQDAALGMFSGALHLIGGGVMEQEQAAWDRLTGKTVKATKRETFTKGLP
jgi:hypothetical protein